MLKNLEGAEKLYSLWRDKRPWMHKGILTRRRKTGMKSIYLHGTEWERKTGMKSIYLIGTEWEKEDRLEVHLFARHRMGEGRHFKSIYLHGTEWEKWKLPTGACVLGIAYNGLLWTNFTLLTMDKRAINDFALPILAWAYHWERHWP